MRSMTIVPLLSLAVAAGLSLPASAQTQEAMAKKDPGAQQSAALNGVKQQMAGANQGAAAQPAKARPKTKPKKKP